MQSRSAPSPLAMVLLVLGCVAMVAALTVIGQPPTPPTPDFVAVDRDTGTPTRTPFVVPSDRPLTPEEHVQVMLGILVASIPPAFALPETPVVSRSVDGRVELVEVQGTHIDVLPGGVRYTASTEAYRDGPYGVGTAKISLTVVVGADAMPVVDDPCSIPGPPQPDTDIVCSVVTTASGVRVRFATTYGWHYISAAVAYPGVTVFAIQGPSDTAPRGTDEPILLREAMAELVAMPALKPS